jgi:hypothetical protein
MQTKTDASDLTRRFQSLITRHAELRSKETERLKKVLDELLPSFLGERKKWAQGQRKSADDFNLFEVLGVEGDEESHSKILAWLLDHRIERGTHAQGNLGFRLFLEELAKELREGHVAQVAAYADEANYWVHPEVSGNEARVDIEIAARDKFLIHLENKIYAAEGEDQTDREWRDLQAKRKELRVPEEACHAIFLTLDGSEAKNKNFRSVGWNRIAKVLDQFATLAEPPEVKLFARHYAKAIRKLSVVECEEQEVEDAKV